MLLYYCVLLFYFKKYMDSENISGMSILELIEYITKTYHEPMRKNLKILDSLVSSIVENDIKNHPELTHLSVLFSQFRTEILRHVTKEDFIIFPTILKYQRIYTDELLDLSDNFEVMDKLINNVAMKNEHTDFELYLTSIIQLFNWLDIKVEVSSDLTQAKDIFTHIRHENIRHAEIENNELYFKWKDLQDKLKEKLLDLK